MKKFSKKFLYYYLVAVAVDLYISNLLFSFNKGFSIEFNLKIYTILHIFSMILDSIIALGVIKLLSNNIDEFIYESNKAIVYFAIAKELGRVFQIPILSFVRNTKYSTYLTLLISTTTFFICCVLAFYYLWKYRLELISVLFIFLFIYKESNLIALHDPDFLDTFFQNYVGIQNVHNSVKGLFLLGIYSGIIAFLIYLRKKGVYDPRSEEEKLQEAHNRGYYARFAE